MSRILQLAVLVWLYVVTSSAADDDNQDCFYEKGEWSECEAGTQTLRRELMGGKSQCQAVKVETRSCESGDQGETKTMKHQPEVEREDTQNRNQAAVVDTRRVGKPDLAKIMIQRVDGGDKSNSKDGTAEIGRREVIEEKREVLRDKSGGRSEGNWAGGRGGNRVDGREGHGRHGNLKHHGHHEKHEHHGHHEKHEHRQNQEKHEHHEDRQKHEHHEDRQKHEHRQNQEKHEHREKHEKHEIHKQQDKHDCHKIARGMNMRRKIMALLFSGKEKKDVTQIEGYSSLPDDCKENLKKKFAKALERRRRWG